MSAWSGEPVPQRFLHGATALERQGALVFQAKQCRNCNSLDEKGGQRGPTLDSVAVRLTQDQLIRQVIQGGGNMPAYGKNLSPAETTALVAFLQTLHPAGQAPARDASRDIVLGEPRSDLMTGANERQRESLVSGAGPGAPASEPAGESEGRSPSVKPGPPNATATR